MLLKYFNITIILFVNFCAMINVYKFNEHASLGGLKRSKYSYSGNNNKLLSLLNLLCNATQTTSLTMRDACYGCFFRAGSLPSGATLLSSLSQCSTMYLVNTSYALCATNLQAVASGASQTTTSTTSNEACCPSYCDFVRCVRQINANTLVDNCIQANLPQRNLINQADRIALFTNTTSCILARSRCNQYNPISGELQNVNPNRNGLFVSNTLQISGQGDVRLITFPMRIGVAKYFCSSQQSLDQSGFGDAIC